jgi:hypothetical protein
MVNGSGEWLSGESHVNTSNATFRLISDKT